MFITVLALIVYIIFKNTYEHKIFYIINTILYSVIAAINFTEPGNDWVNNVWGSIMFLCAMTNIYVYKKEKSLKKC